MPGYRPVPASLSGTVADLTREAALLESQGDRTAAVEVYERAVAAAVAEDHMIPSFLCGRLALLYRKLGRHVEEVALLEEYQATQRSERERVRFNARLSKATALMHKAAESRDCGALASIRAFGKSRDRRSGPRVGIAC
jgi:hypothetical protein